MDRLNDCGGVGLLVLFDTCCLCLIRWFLILSKAKEVFSSELE